MSEFVLERGGGVSGRTPVLTFGMTVLFAVAAGTCVGNLYWAQPLLAQIAESFGVPVTAAGALVTLTQVGYVLGILFLVPTGDILNRRRLIPAVMALGVVALLLCASSPSLPVLAGSLVLLGATTVSGQIVIPLVSDLASDETCGFSVGLVASGVTSGILVARTVSGFVAAALGWRAIYVIAAAADLALAALLVRRIPDFSPRERVSYPALIVSVFSTARKYPVLGRILAINGSVFGVFNLFWTSLTYLLSSPAYGFDTAQIGLMGLVGLAGAVAGQGVGRLEDRGIGVPALGVFIGLALAGMAVAGFGEVSLLAVILAAVLFDVGSQGVSVLDQARLFSLDSAARSRLNTVFVVNNFVCGAIGSALASLLWSAGGWVPVVVGGATWVCLAFVVWVVSRRAFNELKRD